MDSLVREKALEALRQTNDYAAAERLMLSWLAADPVLKERLLEPLIPFAVGHAIRAAAQQARFKLRTAGEPPEVAAGDVLVGARVRETLYDWILPGGLRAGDAVMADFLEAKVFYLGQARGNMAEARWSELVAVRLKSHPRTPMQKVLSLKDLWAMRRRAEKQVDATGKVAPVRAAGDGRVGMSARA